MIFDERKRDSKLYIEAERMKKLTPEESLELFFDMNKAMLRFCIESIKVSWLAVEGKKFFGGFLRMLFYSYAKAALFSSRNTYILWYDVPCPYLYFVKSIFENTLVFKYFISIGFVI